MFGLVNTHVPGLEAHRQVSTELVHMLMLLFSATSDSTVFGSEHSPLKSWPHSGGFERHSRPARDLNVRLTDQ